MHPCKDILKTIRPDFIFDVGASDGRWSQSVEGVWPKSRYILFEPLAEYPKPRKKNWRWVNAAAGAAPGTARMDVQSNLFGSGIHPHSHGREVPVATLDGEAPEHGSTFIKLDTHGYEREILAGAANVLERAVGLQVEVYARRLTPTTALAWELIPELNAQGFRPVAWFDQLNRTGTAELWQADVLFLRAGHPIFNCETHT